MAKVGILAFPQEKDRCGQVGHGNLFDLPKITIGFQQVVSEASKVHDVRYVDTSDTWADFWLASLVSWYDVYNIVKALRGKPPSNARLIVGGPGVLNPWILQDIAWAAVIGRGEGVINKVIGEDLSVSNAWYLNYHNRVLEVGQPKKQIDGGHEKEAACGCPKKCFFANTVGSTVTKIGQVNIASMQMERLFLGT